jgi:integrase
MERLTTTLDNAFNDARIRQDFSDQTKSKRYSLRFNQLLQRAFPGADINLLDASKKVLLDVWEFVINRAARPRNDEAISRTWLRLYQATDRIVKVMFENENTSEGLFTALRKPIRSKFGNNSEIYKQSTYLMGVSRERAIERRQQYQERVSERAAVREQQEPFYDDEIYTALDHMYEDAKEDPILGVGAVMIATGARMVEVLRVSSFSEVQANDPIPPSHVQARDQYGAQLIKVTGIAKDRGSRGYDSKVVVRTLIRMTPHQVISVVDHIRQSLDISGTNDAISTRFNGIINRRIKNYFPQHPDITSHKLRYLNAILSYKLYGGRSAENNFVQNQLAHVDAATSRTYQGVNVQLRHEPAVPNEIRGDLRAVASFSEIKSDVQDIKESLDSDVKLKVASVTHKLEDMKQQLDELKQAVRSGGIAAPNQPENRLPISDLDGIEIYPEFVNPRKRGGDSEAKRFELLDKIFATYRDNHQIRPSQKSLKREYSFSSTTLSRYYNARFL